MIRTLAYAVCLTAFAACSPVHGQDHTSVRGHQLCFQVVLAVVVPAPVQNQDQDHPFLHGREAWSEEIVENTLGVELAVGGFLGVVAKES